jgi:hypothetical protein
MAVYIAETIRESVRPWALYRRGSGFGFLFAELTNQPIGGVFMDTKRTQGLPIAAKYRDKEEWVDARTLHEELGVGSNFTAWIKARIKRYELVEGEDYKVHFKPRSAYNVKSNEYLLSPEAVERLTAVHDSRRHLESSKISTFAFNGRTLNVFQHNGELWFFGVDICNMLKTTRRCLYNRKTEGEMTVITILAPRYMPAPYTVFNEWGLLWFVCRSNRNEAIEVSKWLINEALPKIRKAYAMPPSMLGMFCQFIKSLRKQPETLPFCDRPGFPLNLPAREAQNERA